MAHSKTIMQVSPYAFVAICLTVWSGNARSRQASPPNLIYRIVDLGTIGGARSIANAINAQGQVVGCLVFPNQSYHAFLWTEGKMVDLGKSVPNQSSIATGLNAKGQIIGQAVKPGGPNEAVLWDHNRLINLNTLLPGRVWSLAQGINNAGAVVGKAGNYEAFFYTNGKMHIFGDSRPDHYTTAAEINDSGAIVGTADFHAAIWRNGKLYPLGDPGGIRTEALAINNRGEVVGVTPMQGAGPQHALLWSGGKMTDLGVLPDADSSIAYAINDSGDVVGQSALHAVLWHAGQILDLNQLIPADSGWTLTVARGINTSGEIVGWGVLHRQSRAFLLIPLHPDKQPQNR